MEGKKPLSKEQIAELKRQARLKGYEEEPCNNCGSFTLHRMGASLKCDSCGAQVTVGQG